MAGFMSGFGSGFSDTFGRTYAMEKQKQENTFEKMWDTFERNKTYLDEYKTQDAKDVQAAKAIMEQVPGLPPEGLGVVYEKVKTLGYDDALKWATNVKLEKTGTVQQQTDKAVGKGPKPENPYAPVAPQAAGGGVMDKVKGGLDQLKYQGQKNVYEGQIKRMQEATGLSRKEVEKILVMNKGGMPIDPEIEVAQQNEISVTPKTQTATALLDNVTPDEIWKQRNAVDAKAQEEASKVAVREDSLKILMKSTSENARMVKNNPAVLTDVAKGGSQLIARAQQELLSIIDVATGRVSTEAAGQMSQKRDATAQRVLDLEKNLSGGLLDATTRVSQEAELFAQRKALDAYTLGAMYSQEGRSLSEDERKLLQSVFDSNVGPDAYIANMQELLRREIAVTDLAINRLANRSGITQFNKSVDESKYAGLPGYRIEYDTTPFTEKLKGTEYEQYYKELGVDPRTAVTTSGNTTQTRAQGTPAPAPEVIPTEPTPETYNRLKGLSTPPEVILQQAIAQLNSDRTPQAEQEFRDIFGFLPLPPTSNPQDPNNSNVGRIPNGG